MPRLCPRHTPPCGVLSCSEGWPRLQEGERFHLQPEGSRDVPQERVEARGRAGACAGMDGAKPLWPPPLQGFTKEAGPSPSPHTPNSTVCV